MAKKSPTKVKKEDQNTNSKSVTTNKTEKEEKKVEVKEPQKAPKAKAKKEKKISPDDKIAEFKDKYLRLSAEFDNYRKRTLKEKVDLLKTAGESTIVKILPLMDDFDRAMTSMNDAKDIEAIKKGIDLIYTKFNDNLKQLGLKEIESISKDFDTDVHEAVTKIPAPSKELKGKVVDVIEKGYYLNDKVIRFSKVIIGE